VQCLPQYKTPGSPGFGIVKPSNPSEAISQEEQHIYWSGVGMLLYLVKYTRSDIANVVRELSKGMLSAIPSSFKELKRILKFVIDTKDCGLKLEPILSQDELEWSLLVYSDSDWAGDKNNRHSVTSYIICLLGCPLMWKSRQQNVISLSSSEAELYALVDAAKEVKFIYNVLLTMGIQVKLPIVIRVDNMGAIFMAENVSVSQRTKHIDL
jgi:hypothetical protein